MKHPLPGFILLQLDVFGTGDGVDGSGVVAGVKSFSVGVELAWHISIADINHVRDSRRSDLFE